MTGREAGRDAFARTMLELLPYADDIVLIGGWVHAIYLAEANTGERAIYTEDIDLSIPTALATGDRPSLIDLVGVAGFRVDQPHEDAGVNIWMELPGGGAIDLDLLTDAPGPQTPVPISGQPGLVVSGYPDQHILLENARWIEIGLELHPSLSPPLRIRVPELGAYVLVKALSSERRPHPSKQAKDLVYLFEIVRHPSLGRSAVQQLPQLAARYPAEYAAWRGILERAVSDAHLLAEVGQQLVDSFRIVGDQVAAAARVKAQLRRLLGETPDAGSGRLPDPD